MSEATTTEATGFDALKGMGTQAEPVVHVQKLDAHGRAYATGKRKNAVARVWIKAGTGKMIVNSLRTSGDARTNTGYPAAPEEVSHFAKMLKLGAPKMGDGSVSKVSDWLTANAPK
jgi:hypothetical protein